jgi:hypothetical protein
VFENFPSGTMSLSVFQQDQTVGHTFNSAASTGHLSKTLNIERLILILHTCRR